MGRRELENRLIQFVVGIDTICFKVQELRKRPHLKEQISKSSSSVALNYAESQSAESLKDFRHKISIALKELRETQIGLRIIAAIINREDDNIQRQLKESDELIRIFFTMIKNTSGK